MIHNIRDRNPLAQQFLALCLQSWHRAGLKGKMIERAWNTQPGVNAGIIILGNPRHPLRFHKGNELITTRIKEDVPDLSPFGNLDDITAGHLEPQDMLVEVTRAVQVPCRQSNVRKALVCHDKPHFLRGIVAPYALPSANHYHLRHVVVVYLEEAHVVKPFLATLSRATKPGPLCRFDAEYDDC